MERYKLIFKKLDSLPIAEAVVVFSLEMLEEVRGKLTEDDDIVEGELGRSTTAVAAFEKKGEVIKLFSFSTRSLRIGEARFSTFWVDCCANGLDEIWHG